MKSPILFALFFSLMSPLLSEKHPRRMLKDEDATTPQIKLQLIVDELRSPTNAVFTPDGKLLIAEQTGVIRKVSNGKPDILPFLDLRAELVKLNGNYDERGLLGFVLHPNYVKNGKFYVYYSVPSQQKGSNHKSIIAEFVAKEGTALPATKRLIMTIEEPEANHNGGQLLFGHDGYLYISVGDGGGAGDQHGTIGNGQDLNTLLGKILRIDINKGKTYTVPSDNPFVGKKARPEIWAYGLRNAWRMSIDNKTGRLFAADVGQNTYEEIDIIEKGGNYGWRIMEGLHCFDPRSNCNTKGLKMPIAEYNHKTGVSVTGGYVYRGKAIGSLTGKYIFGDWSGPMFCLSQTGNTWAMGHIDVTNKPEGDLRILSFAQDRAGELYILTNKEMGPRNNKGAIYKLVKP